VLFFFRNCNLLHKEHFTKSNQALLIHLFFFTNKIISSLLESSTSSIEGERSSSIINTDKTGQLQKVDHNEINKNDLQIPVEKPDDEKLSINNKENNILCVN